MHVVVIGAGVIGVTTAYYLSQIGCEVTVVDRANAVAAGASHANGGQLSYSFTDALAKPGFVATIPSLLSGRDTGSQLRLVPALLPWAARFLCQCTSERARQNTVAVLRLAMQSAQRLAELRTTLPFDFAHRAAGKLVLLASTDALRDATATSSLKNEHGCDTRVLSADEAIELEPALAAMRTAIAGAVYSKDDQVADAKSFTEQLTDWLRDSGRVRFMLGHPVAGIQRRGNRVVAVKLAGGDVDADAAVVCAGAWSSALLQPLGIDPQIYPVRGYSVTLPPGGEAPMISITALQQRIVFSRINGYLRIAGFADFRGFSDKDDTPRIAAMLRVAQDCAPHAADYAAQERHEWGGFRPMTPDGRPRIGKTRVQGLFINTGHGMLGWTLACASGYNVARTVAKRHH